jgi:hypothetical protein
MVAWTVGKPTPSPSNPQHMREQSPCLGSGCGPVAESPTWLLEEVNHQCLGSECGPSMPATTWKIDYVRLAQNRSPSGTSQR